MNQEVAMVEGEDGPIGPELEEKIEMSGRKFATVSIIGTYCFVIVGCTVACALGKIQAETYLGILLGFSTMAGTIVTAYFNKERT